MEMTKQRKVLLSLIATSLVGLVVDKVFLGPPESASANAIDISVNEQAVASAPAGAGLPGAAAAPAPTEEADPASDAEAASLPSYASLTERLMRAQQSATLDPQSGSDPFNVPSDWTAPIQIEQTQEEPEVVETETYDEEAALQEQFLATYQLDGTMEAVLDGQTEFLAVVSGGRYNGHGLRVGSRVQMQFVSPKPDTPTVAVRFELVEVGRRYAIWQCVQAGEISVTNGLRVQITLDVPEVQ